MAGTTLHDRIRRQQADWIASRGVETDARGYADDLTANLFALSNETCVDLAAGSGNELGTETRRGKLAAPWSSSALALNVFEPWRTRKDRSALATALGLSGRRIGSLRFEARFPTGFAAWAPANLDAALELTDDGDPELVAIESKLTEPFASGTKDKFADAYLDEGNRERWHGLSHLRELAASIRDRRREFQHVDVPQLVKHAIALRRHGRTFELLLLWYRPCEAPEVSALERELAEVEPVFMLDGVRFRARTYQEVFKSLRAAVARLASCDAQEHEKHMAYLGSRYFSE